MESRLSECGEFWLTTPASVNVGDAAGLQQKLTLEEARELPAEGDVDVVELDGALESFAKDLSAQERSCGVELLRGSRRKGNLRST